MQKDNLNLHVFQTETDVAQNLINDFFFFFLLSEIWGYSNNFSKKTAAFYAEPNEREEAATSSYSATRDFLKYIYSALVAKNRRRSD